jgi:hypothetical protein
MFINNKDVLLIYKILKLSRKLKPIIAIFYKLAKIHVIEICKVSTYSLIKRPFTPIYSFIILVIVIASLSLIVYN